MAQQANITNLLINWRNGDQEAFERLSNAVYEELKIVSANLLRSERSGHTLGPTALLNEAFLKLIDQDSIDWQSRAHFFAVASRIMRRVLISYGRARNAQKRGGPNIQLTLEEALVTADRRDIDLERLEDVLVELAKHDETMCRIVEMKFFGGMNNEEISAVLTISPSTIHRHWTFAKAWLRKGMGQK